MPTNVNCQSAGDHGLCRHANAPKSWFTAYRCPLWLDSMSSVPEHPTCSWQQPVPDPLGLIPIYEGRVHQVWDKTTDGYEL